VVHQIWARIPKARLLVAEAASTAVEVMYPHLLSRLNRSRFHQVTEKWFPMFEWTNRRFAELRNDPADIIHIHNFHGGYASVEALANLARTKRVIWTFHGLWGVTGGCDHPKGCRGYLEQRGHCPPLGSWPIGIVDRTAEELSRKFAGFAGLSTEVIAPSKYFLEVIRSSPVGRNWTVHHIPNGIDPTKFKPAQAGSARLRVLVVNRNFQDPHKGFTMVREALKTTDPQGLELTFVGLHSGWAIEQLPEGFRSRDLGYVGDRETLARLYAESDIFLFASAAEKFSLRDSGGHGVRLLCGGHAERWDRRTDHRWSNRFFGFGGFRSGSRQSSFPCFASPRRTAGVRGASTEGSHREI
jgi:glycosyltransferase involved in cell wall biosynthesis